MSVKTALFGEILRKGMVFVEDDDLCDSFLHEISLWRCAVKGYVLCAILDVLRIWWNNVPVRCGLRR